MPASESASSIQASDHTSFESGYSTPATSKYPTPAAGESFPTSKRNNNRKSIEVVLSARPVEASGGPRRSSRYASNSNPGKVIADSEDEDDDGGSSSFDVKLTKALEEQKSSNKVMATSESPKAPNKRTRASTSGALPTRPLKKSKAEPEKMKRETEQEELDEQFARAVEFELNKPTGDTIVGKDGTVFEYNSSLTTPSNLSDMDLDSDVAADDSFESDSEAFGSESEDPEKLESEDEPIAKVRRTAVAARGRASARRSIGGGRGNRPAARAPARAASAATTNAPDEDGDFTSSLSDPLDTGDSDGSDGVNGHAMSHPSNQRRGYMPHSSSRRERTERSRLVKNHPEVETMWQELEDMPILKVGRAPQPKTISRQLKPFQLEGLAWMKEMEKSKWQGGLLGDEMGLGKTIQAVSLIMSDYPAKKPSLVLVPPVALMQWQSEIKSYTDGTLETFVFHGTNQKAKTITTKELKKYDVIMMSYNSLESMFRKQEKGFKRKDGLHLEKSVIHAIDFHRIILDEAHSIKTRTTMTAKACFALKTTYRWCLTGTPLQNRIGEFFSLIRFLNVQPFSSYLCKQCPCATLEWSMDANKRCSDCQHPGMQHVSVFNQELLNPIQRYGNLGPGRAAFSKLRLLTDRIMLRRQKKDHTDAMELPVKEIYVDRQFFGEEENDFANSIMTSGQRKFDTYVAQGVLLNNYANIFGLIMQMRQVADHPDLILKKNADGGQNILVCSICDEPAEDTVRSRCKHDFCRTCVASYVHSADSPDCPRCHIPLSIDLEQPEIEQEEGLVKKNSIINRIKMENWTSSSKIELLVHELHKLRSNNSMTKSIIFSQFTTMLQLIEWRLRRAGITTVMLDGSMSPAQRQASIEHFMNNVDTECFLVSLKAGGVALNLTEASRVFIVDP